MHHPPPAGYSVSVSVTRDRRGAHGVEQALVGDTDHVRRCGPRGDAHLGAGVASASDREVGAVLTTIGWPSFVINVAIAPGPWSAAVLRFEIWLVCLHGGEGGFGVWVFFFFLFLFFF